MVLGSLGLCTRRKYTESVAESTARSTFVADYVRGYTAIALKMDLCPYRFKFNPNIHVDLNSNIVTLLYDEYTELLPCSATRLVGWLKMQ